MKIWRIGVALFFFFFFQAEDGIRDLTVTGVQTCALPILPDTLADRCIVIRMQRKTRHEQCERLRKLDAEPLKQQCARFVLDHADKIAVAQPDLPAGLSDRATDIWEPLVALADLAGGDWPQKARQAAVSLSATAHESNPIGTLLTD